MSDSDDLDLEIVQEFLIESFENLDQLDRDLVSLEQDPQSRELLRSVFRTIHTIKGTSGFLAFHKLEAITHVGESLLAKLRDGLFDLTPTTASALLRMVDLVRVVLASIELDNTEGDTDVEPLAVELRALLESEVARVAAQREQAAAQPPVVAEAAAAEPVAAEPAVAVPVAAEPVIFLQPVAVEPVVTEPVAPEPVIFLQPVAVEPVAVEPVATHAAQVTHTAAADSAPSVVSAPVSGEPEVRASVGDSTIRVDVGLLEQLVRLTGELVLARNQIVQQASAVGNEELGRACHRLNLVTGELQEGVMRTRMQPIDHVWSKLPRVVRDLSTQLGRQVRLDTEGGDTELDRTLLEAVKDPLTHLVRNAIDHGIETPAVRRAAGKPETGVLRLRAAHEGGQVLLEVSDDGAGLDPALLGRKAVEKGLITATRAAEMSEQELLHLVFIAGFSTATVVTNVSGRGVGMDVVRTNIERIGGSIEVESTLGRGTCWRLRIPLTLAIVPALTIECAGQRFALPQLSLLELVSLDTERAAAGIENVGGAQVYRLRGTLLPLVQLDTALGLDRTTPNRTTPDSTDTATDTAAASGGRVVAVLDSDGHRFGLVVDRVLDTEEIVVKPLSRALKEIGLYAGATILGDGAVSLILDVQGLARRELRASEIHDPTATDTQNSTTATATQRQLLVVSLNDDRRVAMPLEVVTRLEQFPRADLQRVGNRDVVRYRGEIMPVLRLSDHLGGGFADDGDTVPGVVYSARGRSVALIVKDIIDIVDEDAVVLSDIEDTGLIGSALLHDRVAEMLDVRAAILAADPMYFSTESDTDNPGAPSDTGSASMSYDQVLTATLGAH